MDKSGNTRLNAGMRRDTPPRWRGCRDRNDDAVSSVVALMLLLAVIATFLSLYATTYVPGLKEQSEIDRTNTVKEAFVGFSSDVEHIVYKKAGGVSYGYSVPLGAGDVLMSPEKSSGMLSVKDLGKFAWIDATQNVGGVDVVTEIANCSMVSVAFEPSYSFWEEQGYVWQYGYINVTKGARATPLEAYNMTDVLDPASEFSFSPFARQFIEFETKDDGSGNLLNLMVTVVNITPGQSTFTSGNGHAMLKVKAEVPKPNEGTEFQSIQRLNFTFTNSSTDTVASNFSANLRDKTEAYLDDLGNTYNTQVELHGQIIDDQHDTITIPLKFLKTDVAVTIRTLTVYVSAS